MKNGVKLNISTFVIIALIVNVAISLASTAISKYIPIYGLAVATDVLMLTLVNGALVFFQSIESPAIIALSHIAEKIGFVPTTAFWVFMIVIVNAGSNFISSILPLYLHNNAEAIAIQVLISLIATGLVTYLTTLETSKKHKIGVAFTYTETIIAILIVAMVILLGVAIAFYELIFSKVGMAPYIETIFILAGALVVGTISFLTYVYWKLSNE